MSDTAADQCLVKKPSAIPPNLLILMTCQPVQVSVEASHEYFITIYLSNVFIEIRHSNPVMACIVLANYLLPHYRSVV